MNSPSLLNRLADAPNSILAEFHGIRPEICSGDRVGLGHSVPVAQQTVARIPSEAARPTSTSYTFAGSSILNTGRELSPQRS